MEDGHIQCRGGCIFVQWSKWEIQIQIQIQIKTQIQIQGTMDDRAHTMQGRLYLCPMEREWEGQNTNVPHHQPDHIKGMCQIYLSKNSKKIIGLPMHLSTVDYI